MSERSPNFEVPKNATRRVSINLKFYRLDARNNSLNGCTDMQFSGDEDRSQTSPAWIKLGCFKLAKNSTHHERKVMDYSAGLTSDMNRNETKKNFRKKKKTIEYLSEYFYIVH